MGLETELIVRYFGRVQPLAMQAMRSLPQASAVLSRSLGECVPVD
jgi:predicted nuclease with RNAse H fold